MISKWDKLAFGGEFLEEKEAKIRMLNPIKLEDSMIEVEE